jgi:hypothetical protein
MLRLFVLTSGFLTAVKDHKPTITSHSYISVIQGNMKATVAQACSDLNKLNRCEYEMFETDTGFYPPCSTPLRLELME